MIAEYLGIESDYIILGLAAFVLILFIMIIVNMVKVSKLKNKYNIFMEGKSAKSLEGTLIKRLNQVDELMAANEKNEKSIARMKKAFRVTFQKIGMVKYDAFHEMGGKLSFSLALLNEVDDGFIINAVHSREGCYTYIKEVIGGNSILVLSQEEEKALNIAKGIETDTGNKTEKRKSKS